MLQAKEPALARSCLSILPSRSCPCRGYLVRSTRPNQECDRPSRTLRLLLVHRLSGADIVSDRPAPRCPGSASSRNCERRESEDAADLGAASGPSRNRKEQTAGECGASRQSSKTDRCVS